MPDRSRKWLFDCTALSNFALSDSLDLLVGRYGGRAVVTTQVLDELVEGVSSGYAKLGAVLDWVEKGRIATVSLVPREYLLLRQFLHGLSEGESSLIAIAVSRGGIVVTDDRAARAICRERKVVFTGTIGILKACVADGSITAEHADSLLGVMIGEGFFSPVRRISDLM